VHDVAAGLLFRPRFRNIPAVFRAGTSRVRNQARRIDLVAVDAAGRVVGYGSENGFTRYGSEFANGTGDQSSLALYASDEWKLTPRLRV